MTRSDIIIIRCTRLVVVVPFQKSEKNPIDLVAVFRKVSLASIVSLVLNVPLVSIERIEKIRGVKVTAKSHAYFPQI